MILFLINANKKVGYGHLSRSISIANHLKKNQLFFHGVAKVPKGLELDRFKNIFNKKKNIFSIIKKYKIQKVIIDGVFSLNVISKIKKLKCKIIQLNYKHHNLENIDFVINHLVKKKNKKIFSGLKYLVFNNRIINFYKVSKYNKKIRILIMCGGSFDRKFFQKILNILSFDYLKNIEINLVCDKKQNFFKKFNRNIKFYINPSKQLIKNLYKNNNVGICPGGLQLSEMISNRITTLCIPKNNLELKNANFFSKMDLCFVIKKEGYDKSNLMLKKIISDISIRKKTEKKIIKNFFLLGSQNVASLIKKI